MSDTSLPIALGVRADTGQPLQDLDDAGINAFCAREQAGRRAPERSAEKARQIDTYAVMGDVDADNLAEAGWGLLFAADTDPAPYLEALSPLIERRRAEAGEIKIFYGLGRLPARRHRHNLAGAAQGVAEYRRPGAGRAVLPGADRAARQDSVRVPVHTDLYWAVGRLDFPGARRLSTLMPRALPPTKALPTVPSRRSVALFATCHDFDRATQRC
ncbi:hypothetical protein ACTMU2_41810 [Cupriavidus basilensis]